MGQEEWGRGRHLCHVDEVRDDQGPLWGRGLAENHELHPLGDTVEEGDESLQDRVVHGAAVSHETVIVLELESGEASAPCGLLSSPMRTPPLQLPFGGCTETSHPPCDPIHPRDPAFPGNPSQPTLHPWPEALGPAPGSCRTSDTPGK